MPIWHRSFFIITNQIKAVCSLYNSFVRLRIANRTYALLLPNTFRRVSLVYRRTFPRRQALDAFIGVVLENLPDSVHPLDAS